MTALELLDKKREEMKEKMKKVVLPTDRTATRICWAIGENLNITGQTVINYVNGDIKDGYLAESIYNEFKRLKLIK
jgi:predicted transcriptional regulator